MRDDDIFCPLLYRIMKRNRYTFMLEASTALHLSIKRRPVAVILCLVAVAATAIRHVAWITKFIIVSQSDFDSTVREKLEGVTSRQVNTDWRNVQYRSGMFGQGLLKQDEELIIREQCRKLAGVELEYSRVRENICWGPLATNTTCCYCYFSPNGSQLLSMNNNSVSWTCAVARNNSLVSLNETLVVHTKRRHVVWITGRFGYRNRFEREVNAYCQRVRDLNFFQSRDIYCYWDSPDYILQHPKFKLHRRYRMDPKDVSARGGGFWFHKALLVRHLLHSYNDDDFIVYADTDRIDFLELGTFHAVLDTMLNRPQDDLCIEVMGRNVDASHTKEDVLAAFNASKYIRESSQVNGNMVFVRNSPQMKRFVDAWIECVADWHMVTDDPSVLPNGPRFQAHRHDQSILSVLLKTFATPQALVGPPARSYHEVAQLLTFRFRDSAKPICPFASFNTSSQISQQNGGQ